MTRERTTHPRYHGVRKYIDVEAGYALWLPSDWQAQELSDDRRGVVFAPELGTLATSFLAEKRQHPFSLTVDDMPVLREGFLEGLQSLPKVSIESFDESVASSTLFYLEARFTFLEGEVYRKRWTRALYWGNAQLTLVAQGATTEEFEYWLPVFYNIMATLEI